MKRWFRAVGATVLAAGFGLAGCSPGGSASAATEERASTPVATNATTASGGQQRPNDVNANVTAALRQSLVGKVTLDGATITDVRGSGRCVTVIAARDRQVRFDWSNGRNPNPAREGVDGHETLRLRDTAGTEHTLGLGEDQLARRVDAGIGVLLGNCER